MGREAGNVEREKGFCRTRPLNKTAAICIRPSGTCLQKTITSGYVDCFLRERGSGDGH